jgi:hypothetical protein
MWVSSLMRMVGPHGNPTASNLFAIVAAIQVKPTSKPTSQRTSNRTDAASRR